MSTRRKLAAAATAVVIATLSVGCGADGGGTKGSGIKIAYGSLTDAAPVFQSVGSVLKKAAGRAGSEVTTYDNKFDPATALANTRLMIQGKPDVIIQWVPQPAAESVGKLIAASKIPCIAVNVAIPGCSLFNLSNAQTGDEAGAVAADAAKSRGWTASDMSVALLEVSAGGEEGHEALTHFYSTFATQFPTMTQAQPEDISFSTTSLGDSDMVQVDSDQASLDAAYTAMKRVLQIVPKSRHLVVQTQNDDMARGALRAIQQAGRENDTLIASAGADAAAIKALADTDSWIAEGDPSVGQWGIYLNAMAMAIKDGVSLPELTAAPQLTLTKANLKKYYDGTKPLGDIPVPKQSEYLDKYLKASS